MAIDADPTDCALTQCDNVHQSGDPAGEQPDTPKAAVEGTDAAHRTAPQRYSPIRLALISGLIGAVVLGSLTAWLGYRSHQSQLTEQQDDLYLQFGRQAAVNLTTISYPQAEADVARIVDSSTGQFRDDFETRSAEFIGVVKQAKSKSEGTISEAGLESVNAGQARVLVAVNVKTATPADSNPQPRGWRMRITVQTTPDGPKVSNVEFVP